MRRPKGPRILRPVLGLALATTLYGAGSARADVVILDNGARFEGTIVVDDAKGVILERQSGGSLSRMSFERARVRSVERTSPTGAPTGVAPGPGTPPAADPLPPAAAARDEWWMLESGGKIVGSRRLLLVATENRGVRGWRIEERLFFLGRPRLPAVRVHRVEEFTAEFLPTSIYYGERGEADDGAGAPPYETVRSGAISDGVWAAVEQTSSSRTVTRLIDVPARAYTMLGAREVLARRVPRRPGIVDVPVVDSARGEVRVVRAGFTSLGAGDAILREDVLRVEDGDRVLESRWVPGDPPRCVREDVAPGVGARLSTEAQVRAALAPKAQEPEAPTLGTSPLTPGGRREITLPEYGFSFALSGASWMSAPVQARADDAGPRLVATASSRLQMADLRVEWDPKGADAATSPEEPLVARLRALAPDLTVIEPRTPLAGRPSTVWLGLVGTRRGERLRMLVLAGDRGAGRVTMLLSCPESAWPDAHEALDTILASFRWM